MKKNRIFLYLMLALPAFLLQSCLKDQEDKFDDNASLRLEKFITQTKSVLTSSEYGWAWDNYHYSNSTSAGVFGNIYTVQFTDTEVTAMSERNATATETSFYSFNREQGAILSFDTYNSILHYASTPSGSSSYYQARKGDFDLIIDSIGTNLIKLHGKRYGNIMYMRRLTMPMADYYTAVAAMQESMNTAGFTYEADGHTYTGYIDYDYQWLDLYKDGELVDGRDFVYTDRGIRLEYAVDLGGKALLELLFTANGFTDFDLKGETVNEEQFALNAMLPQGSANFEDYAGSYVYYYYIASASTLTDTVEFVADEANKCYYIDGINENYRVRADYDADKMRLEIPMQQVAEGVANGSNTYNLWLVPSNGTTAVAMNRPEVKVFLSYDGATGNLICRDNGKFGTTAQYDDLSLRYAREGATSWGGAASATVFRPYFPCTTYYYNRSAVSGLYIYFEKINN